jgi:uncharacterized protein YqjF (DUF2071 family)
MSANLEQVAHRPWPLPSGAWVMAQIWHDLLFAHWPLPEAILRARIPAELAIDTFDGQGWLGVGCEEHLRFRGSRRFRS